MDIIFSEQNTQCLSITNRHFTQHPERFIACGSLDNGLKVSRQLFKSLGVYGQCQRRTRFKYTGRIIKLGYFVKSKGEIIVRRDPLSRIDRPSLQSR